jgi:uncharacterized membrane protein (DUF485 family)
LSKLDFDPHQQSHPIPSLLVAGAQAGRLEPRFRQRMLLETVVCEFRRTEMEARSYETIQRDPDYQELVRRRSSLGWTLSLIMLVIYFGFILLVAYAPKFLGMRLGTGVTTIGIPIGLFVIVSAFVLTAIYVSNANSKYDALIRRIVER